MIIREDYLKILKSLKDIKIVKILAGIRRCGKSTILEMLKNELINNGIPRDHIIQKNYSNELYQGNYNSKIMFEELVSYIKDDATYYFLLDEIQEIDGWERVINTILENYNSDLYISGSNSKLMASEISTYLTGRYIKIPIYTLSFKEFLLFKNVDKPKKLYLQEYIRFGGFPLVAIANLDEQTSYNIIEDVYNSVVVKDIAKKHQIINIDLFNRVVRFIVDNIGKTFSATSIQKFLKSENRSISIEPIYNYLDWLEKAFVVYRCKRFDLQGKNILKTQEKFYLADHSIKYALYGFNPTSIASTIENIVYLELKRRHFDVFIGKLQDKEIDFVAINKNKKLYIQVCRQLPESSSREIDNLLKIKDNYPKLIITLDEYASGNINGIEIMHLADFLLNEQI